MSTKRHTPGEVVAQQIMADCAQYAFVRAKCAEDSEHPCIVIWAEHAAEHLGAKLDDLSHRMISAGAEEACNELTQAISQTGLHEFTREEIIDIIAAAKQAREE